MLLLAIDTALDNCAAAVIDTSAAAPMAQETLPMMRGHAEALMPLIARVMAASGFAFHDLDRIAVTTGPGSFTGLRVGISAARGIALAADKEAVGVTTLSAFAAPLVAENGDHPILATIDARHDNVYFQAVAGNGAMLMRPALMPLAEALTASRFGAPRLVGNAAQALAQRWPSEAPPPVTVAQRAAPDIAWVGWLGAAVAPGAAPAKPFYLRAPDATPKVDALTDALAGGARPTA